MENKDILNLIEVLKKNKMNGYFVENEAKALDIIKSITCIGDTIGFGGSITLLETKILDYFNTKDYNLLDRYKEGLTAEDIKNLFRKTFFADVFLTSANAITKKGEIYNVDGTGNRVAATLYGPDKVIIIVGKNKIVNNLEDAIERNKNISAPKNCVRLNKKTPCVKIGYCLDCNSEDRICNEYTLIKRQNDPDRIHIIIIDKELGY